MLTVFVNGLTDRQSKYFSNGWCPVMGFYGIYDEEEMGEAIMKWLDGEEDIENTEIFRSADEVEIIRPIFKVKHGRRTLAEFEV